MTYFLYIKIHNITGLSYQMFLRNVKNSVPYKGKIVKVL